MCLLRLSPPLSEKIGGLTPLPLVRKKLRYKKQTKKTEIHHNLPIGGRAREELAKGHKQIRNLPQTLY